MSGVSIPSSFGGITGGSTTGWGGGYAGGQKVSANTTEAVSGPNGKLVAFDPNTMTQKLAAPQAPNEDVNAVGMSSWGVPTYVQNWLQSGGQGTMPTGNWSSNAAGPAPTQPGVTKAKDTWVDKSPKKVAPPPTTTTTTKGATSSTGPTTAQTGVQGLQMHGPWEGANTGPLFVNDQWQGGTGTSQPVATPALGTQNVSPYAQFSGAVWTDPKTGFIYSDSAGKNQMFIGGDKTKPFMATKNPQTGLYY